MLGGDRVQSKLFRLRLDGRKEGFVLLTVLAVEGYGVHGS